MCLAYVVASPRLLDSRVRTIKRMRLMTALSRFVEMGVAPRKHEPGPLKVNLCIGAGAQCRSCDSRINTPVPLGFCNRKQGFCLKTESFQEHQRDGMLCAVLLRSRGALRMLASFTEVRCYGNNRQNVCGVAGDKRDRKLDVLTLETVGVGG